MKVPGGPLRWMGRSDGRSCSRWRTPPGAKTMRSILRLALIDGADDLLEIFEEGSSLSPLFFDVFLELPFEIGDRIREILPGQQSQFVQVALGRESWQNLLDARG